MKDQRVLGGLPQKIRDVVRNMCRAQNSVDFKIHKAFL